MRDNAAIGHDQTPTPETAFLQAPAGAIVTDRAADETPTSRVSRTGARP